MHAHRQQRFPAVPAFAVIQNGSGLIRLNSDVHHGPPVRPCDDAASAAYNVFAALSGQTCDCLLPAAYDSDEDAGCVESLPFGRCEKPGILRIVHQNRADT